MTNERAVAAPPPPLTKRKPWLWLGGLFVLAVLLIWLIPAEKTLGSVIRLVFLHGALVQVGLIAFAAAGLLGVAALGFRRAALYRWCLTVQEVAVLLWVVYALSSMVTTRLAWGEWIAWDEPRVRASVYVLGFSIAALVLVRWVNHPAFTAGANIVVAGVVWYLIKGAGLLRHPFDPIGESNSLLYQVLYLILVAVILAMAVVVARWRQTSRSAG